jgi:GxxExxY protein
MRSDLILPELSYEIVGCCFEVHNQVGGGKRETVYQRALAIEFSKRGMPFEEQVRSPIVLDGIQIGSDVADFVLGGTVVVEIKVGSRHGASDYHQVRRYLLALRASLGILVRFTQTAVVTSRILPPRNPHP